MKPNDSKYLLCVVLCFPFLILIFSIISRHKHLEVALKNRPEVYADYITNTAVSWGSNSFVSIKTNETFNPQLSTALSSIIPENSILSTRQRELLRESFEGMFKAYSDGSYESYCNFRFPKQVKWSWRTNGCWNLDNDGNVKTTSAEAELDRYFKQGPIFGGLSMIRNFYTNFSATHNSKITRPAPEGMDARFKEYVYLYSDCSFYSNFWIGVNFDKCKLIVFKTNSTPESIAKTEFFPMQEQRLATVARHFPNLGYLPIGEQFSLVEFSNSPIRVVEQNKAVTVADAFFYIRTNPPDFSFPILARFYWSPDDEQWLPADLIVCTVKTMYLRYPVF